MFVELHESQKKMYLMYTSSNKAQLYVEDTLKEKYNVRQDAVLEVKDRDTFDDMISRMYIPPMYGDHWLYIIKWSAKIAGYFKKEKVEPNEFTIFLFEVENYKSFRIVQGKFDVQSMYIQSINAKDVMYLLKGHNISPRLVRYVSQAYRADPEAVFQLKEAVDNGIEVKKTIDIRNICGDSSVNTFQFIKSLMSEPPTSRRGIKMSINRRVKMLHDLIDVYSSYGGVHTLRKTLLKDIGNIRQLKMLYLEGVIFSRIVDLPEEYNEKELSRYRYNISTITETFKYEDIIKLERRLVEFGDWYTEADALSFLYSYCTEKYSWRAYSA